MSTPDPGDDLPTLPVGETAESVGAFARAEKSVVERVLFFGKYQLVAKLGRGGMAEVWRATLVEGEGAPRDVALKRVLPEFLGDPTFLRMFLAEARLSTRLDHPNIVKVVEAGQAEGEYFIAMEFLEGRDLAAVGTAAWAKGPQSPGLAAYVIRELCAALAYAHALSDDSGQPLGLIHRDVSPQNLMIGFDGSVKLLDFGLAKALNDREAGPKTAAGTLKGKFGYMAPERFDDVALDRRVDIFSAGVVLWEILTGKRLFKGDSDIKTITAVRAAKVPLPSTVNPQVTPLLDSIVAKATARDRDDRYASADEMLADLDMAVRESGFAQVQAGELMRRLFGGVPEATFAESTSTVVRSRPMPVSTMQSTLRTIVLSAVVACCMYLVMHYVALPHLPVPQSEVPSIAGVSTDTAKDVLTARGLFLLIDGEKADDQHPPGTLVEQRPMPGSRIRRGGEVHVLVAVAPKPVAVPRVVGMTVADAKNALAAAGLHAGLTTGAPDPSVAPGVIIASSPGPGAMAKPGTAIDVMVSSGPDQQAVPSVLGKKLAKAKELLEAAGFAVGSTHLGSNDDYEQGMVIKQNPAANTPAAKGAKVDLIIND